MRAIVFTVLIAILADAAQAAEISPRQSEILHIAVRADGWLTEDMYREFWAALPAEIQSKPEMKNAWISVVERAEDQALKFQRETWGSIMLSFQAGRVIKTPGYESAKATLLSSSTFAPTREQLATGINNAEGLIDAAATGMPFVTPRGTIYVTDELVTKTISGIDASFCRFRKLNNPTWAPKVEEREYADAHVRILSDCPFRRESRDFAGESGKKVRMTTLSYVISEKDQLSLSFAAVGRFAVPEESVARIAQAALREVGIVGVSPLNSVWRGRVSSQASGTVATSQGNVHASVRVVEAQEFLGFWAFMGLSLQSLVDADVRCDSLEASTQLDSQ